MVNAPKNVIDRSLTATTPVWRDVTQIRTVVSAKDPVRWHAATHVVIVYVVSHAFPATSRTAHLHVPIASGKSFNYSLSLKSIVD